MPITDPARPAERVTLYFRRGGSDKVYHVALEPHAGGGGFVVTFAYGRRGGPLATGAKTLVPVAYDAARKLYDKLVKAKTAKGYAAGAAAAAYRPADRADPAGDVLPQLLNPVDESEVDRLLGDDGWWLQQKYDGRRVLIHREDGRVTGINRTGRAVDLPGPVAAAVLACRAADAFLLDGEAVGDAYVAFDLLAAGGADLRQRPYHERYASLGELIGRSVSHEKATAAGPVRCAGTAAAAADKRATLDRLRAAGREGVVFKQRDAAYTPGRPASGGPQLKLKFCATASCVVAGANRSRRSVRLELVDGAGGAGRRVGVGNVTIPPNHPVPARGDVVEVRYLYAYPGGASLIQPVYLGRRDDVTADACTTAQLKFKASDDDDEADAGPAA